MRIRSRFASLILCLFPGAVALLLGIIFRLDKSSIAELFFILAILTIPLDGVLYYLIFYDSNSTCAIFAGNLALKHGFSPVAQDGTVWNPREHRVSEIYNFFPDDRLPSPREGTAGFMFYTNSRGDFSRRVEFYDYRLGGDKIAYFEFYFHSENPNGDNVTKKEIEIKSIPENRRFVALERMNTG